MVSNLCKELYECAERDINASKLLQQKGDYANSVYHLQQAVEKANKSFAEVHYPGYQITYKALLNISHKSPYASIEPLENNYLPECRSIDPDAEKKIAAAKSDMLDKKKCLMNAKMTSIEINNILEIYEKNKTNPFVSQCDISMVQLRLYLLSIITYAHESFTRYPTNSFSPKEYTPGLGIVDELQKLIDFAIETMNTQKKLMNEHTE